jgi:hypothetical protein
MLQNMVHCTKVAVLQGGQKRGAAGSRAAWTLVVIVLTPMAALLATWAGPYGSAAQVGVVNRLLPRPSLAQRGSFGPEEI